MTDNLKKGAAPDTIFVCNGTGWMTIQEFITWFKHFLAHTRPTADNPVLLLLDGHSSHTKNLAFIEKARQCHVTVVCMPPHCSHKLQPLDVSFMGPLKTNFSKALEDYLKANPGKVATLNDVSPVFGQAFMKTSSASVVINGFRKAGIVPLNRFVFTDDDFAGADVTDILPDQADPEHDQAGPSSDQAGSSSDPADSSDDQAGPNSDQAGSSSDEADQNRGQNGFNSGQIGATEISKESTSASSRMAVVSLYDDESSAMLTPKPGVTSRQSDTISDSSVMRSFKVSPEEILPIPKTTTRKITRGRKREKARTLTSSPYRNELKSSQAAKDIGNLKKVKKVQERFCSKIDAETPKRTRGRPKGVKNQTKNSQLLQDSLCEYCGSCFSLSDDGQNWTKCSKCFFWFHECTDSGCPSCGMP
jgi:hypothetical protein